MARSVLRLTPHAALAATVLTLLAAAHAAEHAATTLPIVLLLAAASLPYLLLLRTVTSVSFRTPRLLALSTALIAGLALVAAPPRLSDDVFRYVWDGRVSSHGLDPYLFPPEAPPLAPLRDALYPHINFPEIATIYPPLAQLLFAVVAITCTGVVGMKLLALAAHLATVLVVVAMAPAQRRTQALFGFALNPLALAEAALSGHIDATAALLFATAVWALMSARPWRAAWLFGAAAGTKLVGLLGVPLLVVRDRRAAALTLLLTCVVMVPLVSAGRGSGEVSHAGLARYARHWRGNEGAFVLLELAARAPLELVSRATHSAPGHVRLPWLAPALRLLRDTPLDPRLALTAEKKAMPDPTDFQLGYLASLAARVVALLLVLAFAFHGARRGRDPLGLSRDTILLALLLAPQVHPWYLVWLLPLELARGRVAGIAWSCLIWVAYAPLDGWLMRREWNDFAWLRGVEHLAVWGFWVAEHRFSATLAASFGGETIAPDVRLE